MAKVKAVVVESVADDGYAILNADDDLVYKMRHGLTCKVALFSMDQNNPRVLRHCEEGGLAATADDGFITICKGTWKIRIAKIVNIPLTFGGKALFMIQNILPSALAAFIRNIRTEDIRVALETFIPSPAQTPGRMNMFNFERFTVMIDYAHNTAGLQALGKFIERVDSTWKVGIITGVGDRRDEDITGLGALAAEIFDELIVRQDKHLRGRTDQEIVDLLLQGIKSVAPEKPVKVIFNELAAIEYAISSARDGSFITICSDVVAEAVDKVLELKEKEAKLVIRRDDIPNRR